MARPQDHDRALPHDDDAAPPHDDDPALRPRPEPGPQARDASAIRRAGAARDARPRLHACDCPAADGCCDDSAGFLTWMIDRGPDRP